MNRTLDPTELSALLTPKAKAKKGPATKQHELPPQRGPLRMVDKEARCLNSGYYAIDPETNERFYKKTQGRCGASTYYELNGVAYCMLHCLLRMNEMLIEVSGEGPIEVREVLGDELPNQLADLGVTDE